jgi:hypothetical protein
MSDIIVPEYILYLIPIFFVTTFLFAALYLQMRSGCPEAPIFSKARKKGLPVVCKVNPGSGEGDFFLGEKKGPYDIAFYDEGGTGYSVDPSICGSGSQAAIQAPKGLSIYFFATNQWSALSVKNALGLKTLKNLVNRRFKELMFLDGATLAKFVIKNDSALEHDCTVYIRKYSPDLIDWESGETVRGENGRPLKMTPEELLNSVVALREEFKTTPLELGIFSYTAAFLDNPVTHMAQDLKTLESLIYQLVHDRDDAQVKIMMYAIAAIIVFIGGAIAFYMVTMKH